MSAAYDAAARGDAQALRALVGSLPDLSIGHGPKADTPLHVAARNGHAAAIRVLVDELGGNSNLSNNDGDTPMLTRLEASA